MKRRERQARGEAAELNALSEGIIGAAIKVHRELGPGLLESAYEACLCFELKAAVRVTKLDERQLLTYLRLSDRRLGLLINFNVLTLVEGIKRMVNQFPEASPERSLRSPRPLRSDQA